MGTLFGTVAIFVLVMGIGNYIDSESFFMGSVSFLLAMILSFRFALNSLTKKK